MHPYFPQISSNVLLLLRDMVLRLKRFGKAAAAEASSASPITEREDDAAVRSKIPELKCGANLLNLMGVFAISVMAVSLVFSLSVVVRDPPADAFWKVSEARNLDFDLQKDKLPDEDLARKIKENPLGDLLATGFDKKSCRSRFESALYNRGLSKKASPRLISRLRSYEALHKKCGPYTYSYNKTLENLKLGRHPSTPECNYVVWISMGGLGNRILTLTSTFLYALLTDRVLLVDRRAGISDLFCEPFPDTSWLLPEDFPLTSQFGRFDKNSNVSYGNMLGSDKTRLAMEQYVYVHLAHDYGDRDKLFFCNQDHLVKIPWLIVKSDNYFAPFLFLTPGFEHELHGLFPNKESIFHLLGRYLLHPTNSVWGLITRYYRAYLSKADVKVGIQVRVFDPRQGPLKHVLDQILSCVAKENILPKISERDGVDVPGKGKTVAVLVTSLIAAYYEEVRNMYWEHATESGEVVGVYQPSHEGFQQTGKHWHDRKAWAEMYLLGMMDKLVTSSWSTFGYVAQGVGGVRPWILTKAENGTVPEVVCSRAESMEPCFHAPPYYDCRTGRGADMRGLVPYVRHCEDVSWGLKLVDIHQE
ncbi:galactoside 2-alpha-L-fucosyltransferase-like [Andrographis paniculata]|uniref:galactoside 2-alpha-L-fucosyltransferase-like n=1 Tax=Andrographis paniculata TaxID=175694 RepID=UPI0021E6D8D5|nr:galactoside 2-alpha-L-fucosyltransferase-like [Andrographis paniculata]